MVILPEVSDSVCEVQKPYAVVAALLWQVGCSEEGLLFRSHDDCQWPTAPTSHHLGYLHVDAINIGTLLSVDLDIDEDVIHLLGNFIVFKRFMGHDMTPVTCAVSN